MLQGPRGRRFGLALAALVVLGLVPGGVAAAAVSHDPTVPPATSFVQLTAGSFQTCGVTAEGTAYCWGNDGFEQLGNGAALTDNQPSPSPVDTTGLPAGTTFTQLTAGGTHTCGLTGTGSAYCWGSDHLGRLGNGAALTDNQPSPSPVDTTGLPAGTTFTQLTAGGGHTCGVTGAGAAYCWGTDFDGQLGNGAALTDNQPSPSPVDTTGLPAGTTFTQLTAGFVHTCGLTGAGAAYCWGRDDDGQLGNGVALTGNQPSPSPVDTTGLPAGTTFTQLTARGDHTCGLTATGAAYCWGDDGRGQLGNGAALIGDQPSPSPVDTTGLPAGTTFTQLTTSAVHTCGLTATGATYCWGSDTNGRLGNGAALTDDQPSPSPVDTTGLPPGTTFTQLTAGDSQTCGITGAGAAYCWGSDTLGQLGNGAALADDQPSPSPVDETGLPVGTTFIQLTTGRRHTCGLTGAGTAYCWGSDDFGQLGNGPDLTGDQDSPSLVDVSGLPAGTTFTQLTAGHFHTCGLTGIGNVYCWGSDTDGRLGNGPITGNQPSPSPVDTTGLPAGTTFTQLTGGFRHTCGVTSSGTAYCWGGDGLGRLGNGSTLTDDQESPSPVDVSGLPAGTAFTQLTAAFVHTCGLTSAGTAYCWGSDSLGRLGNGSTLTDDQESPSPVDVSVLPAGTTFAQLTAGGDHVCGRTTAGTAYCWGVDFEGQLGNGAITGTQFSPSPVATAGLPAGSTFAQLTAGEFHTCGLTGAGAAYCWGEDENGRLGNGPALTERQPAPSPVNVSGLPPGTTFTQLDAGEFQTCGLTGTRAAYCWGEDSRGQLGNGAALTDDQPSPSAVDLAVAVTLDDQTVTAGEVVTLEADVSGVGPASWQWFRDSVAVAGQTDPTYVFTATTADRGVEFSVTVTNAFNRTDSDTATLTVERPSTTSPGPGEPGPPAPEPEPGPPAPPPAAGVPPDDFPACPPTTFSDTAGNPHQPAIDWAAAHGIVCGYPDGTYRPAEPVRRDQFAALLARTLTTAGHQLPAPDHPFTDLGGNLHATAIGQLTAAGIIHGTTADSFGPDQPVSRAQTAALLVRALMWAGVPVPPGGAGHFPDTAGNAHADAIDAAHQLGLTHGTTPSTFSPDELVRRDQTATFLMRLHALLV